LHTLEFFRGLKLGEPAQGAIFPEIGGSVDTEVYWEPLRGGWGCCNSGHEGINMDLIEPERRPHAPSFLQGFES
jgi:hypothetical protein